LVCQDLGLKLHEGVTFLHLLFTDGLLEVNYPTVSICHHFSLLIQLFLLTGQYLRHGKASLFSLLLKDLLLVLKAEQFSAVLQEGEKEIIVLRRFYKVKKAAGHSAVFIFFLTH
jgi:hypothetical protein